MPGLGITGTSTADTSNWYTPTYVRLGPVLRKFDNTTVELLQRGVEINNYSPLDLTSLGNSTLGVLSSRLRGANLIFYEDPALVHPGGATYYSWKPFVTLLNGYNPDIAAYNPYTISLNVRYNDTDGQIVHLFPQSLFQPLSPTTASVEGAVAVVTGAGAATGSFGRLVIHGGLGATGYVNTLIYRDLPINSPLSMAGVTQTGTPPSPRAYHAGVLFDTTISTGLSFLLIWGGQNGALYYNDGPFVLDIVTGSWTTHAPAGPIPPARAGHTLTRIDGDRVILHGGKNGATTFNDLWSYSLTARNWTQLLSGGNEPAPRPRAYHAAIALDSVTIAFHGGRGSANEPLSDWVAVNVNETCPFWCPHPSAVYGSEGACMSAGQCVFLKECSYEAYSNFQCGLGCTTDPSLCTGGPTVAATCPDPVWNDGSGVNATFRCWHGFCVSNPLSCKVWPRCGPGEKRCDGDCVPETQACSTNVQCPPGTNVCVDGRCLAQCPPYDGCLPNGKPVQCWDGSCATTIEECDRGCPPGLHKCWDGCGLTCPEPYWTDAIHLMAFQDPQLFDYYLFKKEGQLDTDDVRGIIDLQDTKIFPNMTVFVRSAYSSEKDLVGPEPNWPRESDPGFFLSSIMFGTFRGITEGYRANPNTAVNLIFRHPVSADEASKWALSPSESLGYIQTAACVAFAVPWYWDPSDLNPNSGLANVSYIRDYRLNATGNFSGPMAAPPPFRWKCQRNETNVWPRIIRNVPFFNDTRPNADKWLGIRVSGDVEDVIMAMIVSPAPLVRPPPEGTPLVLPPPDPVATYIVLACAAVLLAILIVVVVIKSLSQRS